MTHRILHKCSHCGKESVWADTWTWYGSYRELENGKPIIKVCSDECLEALRISHFLPEPEEKQP